MAVTVTPLSSMFSSSLSCGSSGAASANSSSSSSSAAVFSGDTITSVLVSFGGGGGGLSWGACDLGFSLFSSSNSLASSFDITSLAVWLLLLISSIVTFSSRIITLYSNLFCSSFKERDSASSSARFACSFSSSFCSLIFHQTYNEDTKE